MSQEKGVPIYFNIMSTIGVGIGLLSVTSIFFGEGTASWTSLDFMGIVNEYFSVMSISGTDQLGTFWPVLLTWLLAGLAAGARAKSAVWGGIAAGNAAILTFVFIAVLPIVDFATFSVDIPSELDLTGFALGAVASSIVCIFSAGAAGRATTPTEPKTAVKRTRKAWSSTKKDIWKCSKCGNNLPPGALSCPNCGESVLE